MLAPSQWPNVVVYLCAVLAAFFLVALAVDLVASRRKTPPWRSYTKGTYLGVDWTWSYSGSGDVVWLTPFCPVCQMALQYEETDPLRRVLEPSRMRLVCTDCGGGFAEQARTFQSLLHRISLFIERDVRTGEFAKKVKPDQPSHDCAVRAAPYGPLRPCWIGSGGPRRFGFWSLRRVPDPVR